MVVRDMKAVARRITRRADWLRLNHRGWRPVWAYELLAGVAFHLAGENQQAQRLFSQASQTAWPRSLDSVPVWSRTPDNFSEIERAVCRQGLAALAAGLAGEPERAAALWALLQRTAAQVSQPELTERTAWGEGYDLWIWPAFGELLNRTDDDLDPDVQDHLMGARAVSGQARAVQLRASVTYLFTLPDLLESLYWWRVTPGVATRQSLQRAIDRALGESRLLHRLEGQLYILALTTRFPALRG